MIGGTWGLRAEKEYRGGVLSIYYLVEPRLFFFQTNVIDGMHE